MDLSQISNDFLSNTVYDIIKFIIGYLIARWLVDGLYMKWRWGNWRVLIVDGDKELASRKITPTKAKTILKDDNDLAVYLKGVVSPHAWLGIDILSNEAKNTGLFTKDENEKKIIIDISKNPAPDDKKINS